MFPPIDTSLLVSWVNSFTILLMSPNFISHLLLVKTIIVFKAEAKGIIETEVFVVRLVL